MKTTLREAARVGGCMCEAVGGGWGGGHPLPPSSSSPEVKGQTVINIPLILGQVSPAGLSPLVSNSYPTSKMQAGIKQKCHSLRLSYEGHVTTGYPRFTHCQVDLQEVFRRL